MNSKRIQYIDAMRGFTMFLVVVAHVYTFSFGWNGTFLSRLFLTFRMPLFFFISGFVAYKVRETWTHDQYHRMLWSKIRIQLVPTIVFFGLFYSLFDYDLLEHFSLAGFGRFWFTFVLLEFLIIYYSFSRLANIFHFEELIPLMCFVIGCLGLTMYDFSGCMIFRILRMPEVVTFFPYFTLGLLCRRFYKKFNSLIINDVLKTGLLISFVTFLFIDNGLILSAESFVSKLCSLFFVRVSGLFFVFSFFISNHDYFENNGFCSRIMQFVGRRTLDIYMLHYFFLPTLPGIGCYLKEHSNLAIEIVLTFSLSALIISISLFCSMIIRNSQCLGHYLFAAKKTM